MANAEACYVDPSVLRRLYVHEENSREVAAWRQRRRGELPVTLQGRLEIINSVMHAVFTGALATVAADAALRSFREDFDEGRLQLVDLPWRRAYELAARLGEEHSAQLGTRSLDVLHVASAIVSECRRFVTYDRRQAALAEAVGLKVIAP